MTLQGQYRQSTLSSGGNLFVENAKLETVSGAVTGVVKDIKHRGFYLQMHATREDVLQLPFASQAIFVSTNDIAHLSAGKTVCVRGYVVEYYGMTTLVPDEPAIVLDVATAIVTKNIYIAKRDMDFRDTLERYEGMRVRFTRLNDMRITKPLHQDRFGQALTVTLSRKKIQSQPNNQFYAGGILAAETKRQNKVNRIILRAFNRHHEKQIFNALLNLSVLLGDKLHDIEGILTFRFGEFYLLVTKVITANNITHITEFKALTVKPDHSIRLMSFNLNNYFTSHFSHQHNALGQFRGRRNNREHRQHEKGVVETIIQSDADFIGLSEVENNGQGVDSAIYRLNALVNKRISDKKDKYEIVVLPKAVLKKGIYVDGGAISVAGLYRPGKLSVKDIKVLTFPVQIDAKRTIRHRNSILVTLARKGINSTHGLDASKDILISINHWKSKGSRCLEDKVEKDTVVKTQGNCAAFRVTAAHTLLHEMNNNSRESMYQVIMGDLNAYQLESPILFLTDYNEAKYGYRPLYMSQGGRVIKVPKIGNGNVNAGGFYNPHGQGAWSYSFKAIGQLDYILVNKALNKHIVNAQIWHINTSYSPLNKYCHKENCVKDKIYNTSDHDPVILDLK